MRMNQSLVSISLLLVFTGTGAGEGEPRSKPEFAVALRAARAEFKAGAQIPVKLTMTNTSDRDLRYTVFSMYCPPPENLSVTVRQLQVLLYDSEGNLVPQTVYGAAVQGRTGPVVTPVGGDRQQGVGCGGSGTLEILKPGESRIEEADLSKKFEIKQPGTYTIRAQRFEKESKAVIKSDAVTVTISAAQ